MTVVLTWGSESALGLEVIADWGSPVTKRRHRPCLFPEVLTGSWEVQCELRAQPGTLHRRVTAAAESESGGDWKPAVGSMGTSGSVSVSMCCVCLGACGARSVSLMGSCCELPTVGAGN